MDKLRAEDIGSIDKNSEEKKNINVAKMILKVLNEWTGLPAEAQQCHVRLVSIES